MRVELRHQPSFATARVFLDPGESFQAESGALVMQSFGIEVHAQAQGGVMKALSRSVLGGASFFITSYTAHPEYPGWVDVAGHLPGDIVTFDVSPGRGLALMRHTWLASGPGVALDTKWGGAANLFGGQGGFVIHASGQGPVIATCYGALDRHDLPDGGGFTVDHGHVVAYDEQMPRPTVRTVSRRIMSTLKSGDGFVMDFVGPGTVWTQSRNVHAFIHWLAEQLPSSS